MSQSRKGEGARECKRKKRWGKEVSHFVWVYSVCLLNFISSHVLYKSLQELREEVKSLMHTGLQTEIQFVLLESK